MEAMGVTVKTIHDGIVAQTRRLCCIRHSLKYAQEEAELRKEIITAIIRELGLEGDTWLALLGRNDTLTSDEVLEVWCAMEAHWNELESTTRTSE